MTSQVLFRTDSKLKQAFQEKAKAQGVSMDFILNTFVRTYVEKPDIIQTYVDDDAFDEMLTKAWSDPNLKPAFDSLYKTLKSK
jgi:antitoxin component of RelBE/YafQ-DinJ toxin-antitoxin module